MKQCITASQKDDDRCGQAENRLVATVRGVDIMRKVGQRDFNPRTPQVTWQCVLTSHENICKVQFGADRLAARGAANGGEMRKLQRKRLENHFAGAKQKPHTPNHPRTPEHGGTDRFQIQSRQAEQCP